MSAPRGLIVAAPASGSGKTTITLGLLRALRRRGVDIASAKVGPDYIDPAFHAAATGRPCPNLDSWAMRPETLAATRGPGADLLVVEGVMGLFDGANLGEEHDPYGDGSTASIARRTGWPVLLVVDVGRQAQSVAALVAGFAAHDPEVRLAGVILNKVGSDRHEEMLRRALLDSHHPVLGAVARDGAIERPSRHLGLVQAGEHPDLEAFLEQAADRMEADLDLEAIIAAALPGTDLTGAWSTPPLPPLGQRIAVARDAAFAFSYPHILDGWRSAGAELSFFSPLSDESPARDADAVYLPGGYPELHAGRLSAASGFIAGMRNLAESGKAVYGECGGYMVLGRNLTDADGADHPMLGLLPHATSFAVPKRHLGYRDIETLIGTPFGPAGTKLRGHEFHYAAMSGSVPGTALFGITDAAGSALGEVGGCSGPVFGSFLHLIDRSGI
ncbi:cobyrinate a,c-diamide synthase [Nisaea acidiphila]|uniref:Cobyrinate a,c-diamide synthase n=1 Tax=Nisaea acidiphila TaxID=1862145 RepID=A0A9J7ASL6_9PROT|nr:cobyrinate a,c-diamide synthase [Nisaea acidiphila]UUX48341.1 cobyrinate a,c-diamide synthase [Nisaea acidiphila]